MSVLQAGKIITDTIQELCLIRNLSSRGVMTDIFTPIEESTSLHVEFKTGLRVAGIVRWTKDGRAGIEFEDSIDVHTLLASNTDQPAPRAPRLSIDGTAKIVLDDDDLHVQVIDISQGGMKVEADSALQVGEDIVVESKGLPVRPSVVRWIRDGQAGISFNQFMPLDQIAFWAARQNVNNDNITAASDH